MAFSMLQEENFFGRTREFADILRNLSRAGGGQARSIILAGSPGSGKTELIRHLFGHLFWKQDVLVPFSYTVNPALLSARAFAQDYLTRFFCCYFAFNNREQALLAENLSFAALTALVEEQGQDWARKIVASYEQNAADPIACLRTALNAPTRAALSAGKPCVVMIDEFHRLKGLEPGRDLVSLFEDPMAFGKSPHIIAGNDPEILEMPVAAALESVSLLPLDPGQTSALAGFHTQIAESRAEAAAPPELLVRLGGNPLYISRILDRACPEKNPKADDYWKAYAAEIAEGAISLHWTAVLKRIFPLARARRAGLLIAHAVCRANEPLSCERLARMVSLPEDLVEQIAHGLFLSGVIRGEWGSFRAPDDQVLRDVIDALHEREISGTARDALERKFLAVPVPHTAPLRFELVLPMAKDAELVAAQCLEQIGKNMQIDRDAIGQMQIAVIEACINAMEHAKGAARGIFLSVAVESERLEVGIEHEGPEFIVQETGEPFTDKTGSKASGRGWGIKLMRRFVDEVSFMKTGRGVKAVLVKKIAKAAHREKESVERE